MGLKSLVINLKNQTTKLIDSDAANISFQNSLTVFRGQSFFTSSFTIKNKHGHFILCLDKHYERFLRSYHRLFECSEFPLTYKQFKHYIDDVLNANMNANYENLHCVISCIAGKPQSQQFLSGEYSNGFGGDLEEIVVIVNPFKPKPDWCYKRGLNILTMPYQRPFATAKPAHYLGGVQGQHILEALNVAALLINENQTISIDQALTESYRSYQSLPIYDQYAFRRLCHDCRLVNTPEALNHVLKRYPKNILKLPLFESLSFRSCQQLESLYKDNFKQLWHEVIFVSEETNPFLYEGSTFSLMGIDHNDSCVFIPLEGNTTKAEDLNTGYVLESTSIALLQEVAKQNKIPYKIAPIRYNDVRSLKALYCISTTRMSLHDQHYQLQPCVSFDNQSLQIKPSKTYENLMKGVKAFMDTYSYNVKLDTPYLRYQKSALEIS